MKEGWIEGTGTTIDRANTVRIWRSRLLVGLWLLFSLAVLAPLYSQVGHLNDGDPSTWALLKQGIWGSRAVLIFWLACTALFLAVSTGFFTRLLNAGKKFWISVAIVLLGGIVLFGRFAPFFGEASLRAAQGILGAGLVLAGARDAGRLLARRLGWAWENRREALLYEMGVGLGILAYFSFALALLGIYRPQVVQAIVLLLTLASAVRLALRLHRLGWRGLWDGNGSRLLSFSEGRAWQGIAAVAALVTLVGALAPEIEYDALWYHLWLPNLWLAQGHPVDLVKEYVSLYPLTWELVYGAGMALGGVVAAKLINWAAFLLAGLLAFELARRFFPRASAWLAAALFLAVPTVLWEASTAYNDLGLALYTGLGIFALMRYAQTRGRQWLALSAITLGLALAVKHLALFALALSVPLLALWLWRADRKLWPALRSAALIGLCALLVPLPWYLRSFLASGNPFFPEMFNLFGATPAWRWDALNQSALDRFLEHFGFARTPWNLIRLPWLVTVRPEAYGGLLGPLFLLLLPVLLFTRRGTRRVGWLASFCILFVILWATPLSSFQMRFLVSLVPILAVLGAEAFSRLEETLKATVILGAYRFLTGMVLLLMALNLPAFTPLQEPNRYQSVGWLTHVLREAPVRVVAGLESQQSYLTRSIRSYAAWQYINANLPQDALVLTFTGGDNLYSLRDRLDADTALARPATWGALPGQDSQAVAAMHRLGITHILIDQRQVESGYLKDIAIGQLGFESACFSRQYEDGATVLFRLTC